MTRKRATSAVGANEPTSISVKQVLAEFYFRDSADRAIQQLRNSELPAKNMTILARGLRAQPHPTTLQDSADYLLVWKEFLALCGSQWAVSFAPTVIFVPEVGCVFFAGWLVSTLSDALNSTIIDQSLGTVGTILTQSGISKKLANVYEESIKAGRFLVIVRGNVEETKRATSILAALGATGLDVSEHRLPNCPS